MGSFLRKIDPIARTIVNFQFTHAFTDGAVIAQIAESHTIEPDADLGSGSNISKPFKLKRYLARRADIIFKLKGEGSHDSSVAFKLHYVNGDST